MKKFSLKPQGGSCMKMFCKSWLFIGLLATFCLAACSDDDDKAETPVFPAKQNIVCNAGETTDFTFTANTNWSLASSAIWCKFKSDATEEYVVSGTAGTHTVTVMATDDDQKIEKASVAKLELTMDGETIVIGEVTRSAVGTELKIFDLEGNEIDKTTGLKVGYDNFAQFKVKANFRFAATNLPGWVELQGGSLVGAVDKEVTGGLKIIQDENREKYPVEANIEKNVITFADEEGKAFYEFPVYYEGMDPAKLDLKFPTAYPTNWIVSLDGQKFTQKSSGGSTGDATLYKRIPFTIKTLNDDFEIVYMEEWEDWQGKKNISLIDPSMLWMHCEGENGKINLTVDEYKPNTAWGEPESRTGYVLALPRQKYTEIEANIEGAIVENGEIKYEYEQKYLLIAFTQKDVKEETDTQAFKVTYYDPSEGVMQEATCTKSKDNYGYETDEVYVIKQPNSGNQALTIDPFMEGNFEEDWTVQVFMGDNNVTKDYFEPMDKTFTISNNKVLTEDLHICIKQNYQNVKVLIITLNN
ncbi:DUF5003 domain-containing protein [Bacteroides sp.]|uniref:DUF5003 domain-containing protein n=1 Tax=Bacteroides sp. TaxID=29523 RepID=UPI00262D7C59|nr:DUF5003 domain-containing protein [Bacteroides sp.]